MSAEKLTLPRADRRELQLNANWRIALESEDPVARFAAQELRRTLQRMGGPALPIGSAVGMSRIRLHHGASGDGFVRLSDAQGLTLRGDGPRGLLYAVYDLLEALGCRWVSPGLAGEALPRFDHVLLPHEANAERPALAGRCLTIGHDLFLAQAEAWIVWAARNRLNTIFVHTTPQRLALGACRLSLWRRQRAKLLPLLRERGMTLELGGHGLSALLPRHLFSSDPELFRFDGQRRSSDYNFCPSNPQTLAVLKGNAAAFFTTYPEAAVYHLWADDLHGGGWCHCEHCAGLSASEQALLAINAVAEALAECNPAAHLAYLAYHDTAHPPQSIVPNANVCLCYAPRSRSYAHGIGDAFSDVNRQYAAELAANLTAFRAAGRGQTARVFEYYLDGILFKSTIPPLGETLRADLRYYRDAGMHTVQALLTADRAYLVAPLNAYLFARLAWNSDQTVEALLRQYSAVRAPRSAESLHKAYEVLEASWRLTLDIRADEQRSAQTTAVQADEQATRQNFFARAVAFVATPPTDVLDYMAAPRPACEFRLGQLQAANAQLVKGSTQWPATLASAHSANEHLSAEYAEWQLSALRLRYMAARQELYVLQQRRAARRQIKAAHQSALAALAALEEWGRRYISGRRARANYALLRTLDQLHLDVCVDQHTWPWQRWMRRLKRLTRLARLYVLNVW